MNKIKYETRKEVYIRAVQVNGFDAQMIVALEELSEVQKEVCKVLRGKGSMAHLAEEIADATIMLEQLRLFSGLNPAVCHQMDVKVARLAHNLGIHLEEEDEANEMDSC